MSNLATPLNDNAEEIMEINDNTRGLNYDENLLFEKEFTDTPGVDLPTPKGTKSRTGQATREQIGLHQVSEPQVVRHFVRLSTKNYSIDIDSFHGYIVDFFSLLQKMSYPTFCVLQHNRS